MFEALLKELPIKECGHLILGIIIGWCLVVLYNRFLGLKALKDSYKQTITAHEKHISTLATMIGEELKKIQPRQEDKDFFRRLRRYFREHIGS